MDRFHRVFQKSNENTACELYTEMTRLLKVYAANILKRCNHCSSGQPPSSQFIRWKPASWWKPWYWNKNMDWSCRIGSWTWPETILFCSEKILCCYHHQSIKCFKIFHLATHCWKTWGSFSQRKQHLDRVQYLAERFPQLGLADDVSIDQLREEFMDFTLSPLDLPSVSEYKAADDTLKPRVGLFWSKVGKITTLDGQERFGLLCKLMYGLLSIPCSNADSERGFSILRKIHTDQRSNLDQSTIIAFMSMKFNSDNCCYDIELCEDLLSQCKQATRTALRKWPTKLILDHIISI